MITFKKIYEALFHSFQIGGASSLLRELKEEHVEKVYVVQRSWIYGAFVSLSLLLIVLLLLLELYLERGVYQSGFIFFWITSGVLILNTVGILIAGIAFLRFYKKIHRKLYELSHEKEYGAIETIMQLEDRVFNHFFNQVTGSYFIAIFLFCIHIFYYIYMSKEPFGSFSFFDITFSLLEVFLIGYYRRKVIDLQMDYIVVVAGKIYFIDQSGVYKKTQALRLYSNIRFITSSFPNFLASLFDYGTIEIITKNDFTDVGTTFHMHYIDKPIETVNQINFFMAGKMDDGV